MVAGATKPFAKGANILAKGYGDLYRGMSGNIDYVSPVEEYIRSGITDEEHQKIEDNPYLEILKSGAGMAGTLAPVAGDGFRTANIVSKTLPNKWLQSILQGTVEGSLRGFGDRKTGQEGLGMTKGAITGVGGELLGRFLGDSSFRDMLKDRNLADIEDVTQSAMNIYKRNMQNPKVPNSSSRPFMNIKNTQQSMSNYMDTAQDIENMANPNNLEQYRNATLDILDAIGLDDYPQELETVISRLSGTRGGEKQIYNLIREYATKLVSGI